MAEPHESVDIVSAYLREGGVTLDDLIQTGLLKDTPEARASFGAILRHMEQGTPKSFARMAELGIDLHSSIPNINQLQNALDNLGDLSEEERIQALMDIFGVDGIRAANALYRLVR